jgi:xanthine dehydrogenase YagS FAD-binding subunit
MNKFSYAETRTVGETIPLLGPDARPLAGGTDLLTLIKDGLAEPDTLVNIKRVEELRSIRAEADGLHIGALTTLDQLDRDPLVRERYAALAQAASLSASPQLRNMATLGGNLLQQVRCWYYRSDFHCWLKGGTQCHARTGENQFHAIWDQSPCVAVYPSDPPAALIAFDATLRIAGANGERTIAVADLLQPPTVQHRSMHTLAPDELIVEIVLPPFEGRSVYHKAMDRATWAYALASVAATARLDNGRLRDVRIVVGGVANVPVRATAAETVLEGQHASADVITEAARAAVQGVQPLAHNAYKVSLVRNLVRQAVLDIG